MTMRYRTFSDWQADGYRIIKGMKSAKRDEAGAPLFNEHQVTRRRSVGRSYFSGGNSDHGSGDWDSDPGYSDLGIDSFQ